MSSLTDVYRGRVGAVASRRRVVAGVTLFAAGAAAVAVGILLATTAVGTLLGLDTFGARELAGVLAGVGLPAAFVGVFAVLPASRVTRAAAAVGASLCVFAVALFVHAYPTSWPGAPAADPALALATLIVYFVGAVTTGWCLFVSVATFKTRKSPGGSAEMRITEAGRIKLVRGPGGRTPGGATGGLGGVGGIGLFGRDPDGNVPTQTGPAGDGDDARTASDGGTAAVDADGTVRPIDESMPGSRVDRYCGNCDHFHYIRVDGEIRPYCDHHERYMDDMDACDAWSSNGRPD